MRAAGFDPGVLAEQERQLTGDGSIQGVDQRRRASRTPRSSTNELLERWRRREMRRRPAVPGLPPATPSAPPCAVKAQCQGDRERMRTPARPRCAEQLVPLQLHRRRFDPVGSTEVTDLCPPADRRACIPKQKRRVESTSCTLNKNVHYHERHRRRTQWREMTSGSAGSSSSRRTCRRRSSCRSSASLPRRRRSRPRQLHRHHQVIIDALCTGPKKDPATHGWGAWRTTTTASSRSACPCSTRARASSPVIIRVYERR